MLHPKHNWLDYGEQLIPPPGYELSYAVGTSYSLDLEALVMLPAALFYSQLLDTHNPGEVKEDMLEAITQASDKISIFCQKGKIKVPKKYQYLIAFWEKGIKEIVMPNSFSSFHPKVWVIRFTAPDRPAFYRTIITSRNLTFARDWDIAFSTEGVVGRKKQEETGPLVDFIQYLSHEGKQEFPDDFVKDLARVTFDVPAGFDKLSFFPIGIPRTHKASTKTSIQASTYLNPLEVEEWDELLIISPFVNDKTVDHFSKSTKRRLSLLSRKEELDTLRGSTITDLNCYQFSQSIEAAEYNENVSEDAAEEACHQSIHAKIYIGEQHKLSRWYLGSANCTSAALKRNVEFLVGLQSYSSAHRSKEVLNLLTTNAKSEVALFEPYDLENRTAHGSMKEHEAAIRAILYGLTITPITGSVAQVPDGTVYDLTLIVHAEELRIKAGYEVRIKPLPEKSISPFTVVPGQTNRIEQYFKGYEERQLSSFMQWEIWHHGTCLKQFLVQIDIELPQSRLDRIFTYFIDNQNKFLRYLTFLLTGDDAGTISLTDESGENRNQLRRDARGSFAILDSTPVFEKLLLAASRFPHKLQTVDKLINRLKMEVVEEGVGRIISPEFEEMWDVFKGYLERKEV